MSDEDTIKDTAVAQPLLVGAGLLALRALGGGHQHGCRAASAPLAGHSVGEITAAAAAGVLREDDAMRLVALRGRAMAEASAATPTGMSAVLGGDPDDVLATIERHCLTPANVNGAGQVVAAGSLPALAALAADPPAKARVIPLKVAGAFHTHYMAPAVERPARRRRRPRRLRPGRHPRLQPRRRHRRRRPRGPRPASSPRSPTRSAGTCAWSGSPRSASPPIIELPPAGTLVGLAKRALKGVELLAVKTPDDLDAARTLIQEHSA